MNDIKLSMSKHFEEKYEKAGLGLRALAEHVIHDFVNLYRSDPRTVTHYYDRLAQNKRILEIDLAGGPRLLAYYDPGHLMLLQMGEHSIVSRYSTLDTDLRTLRPAPQQFRSEKAGFFTRNPDAKPHTEYLEELYAEWIYFLTAEQDKVHKKITSKTRKLLHQGGYAPPYFILGGPGTGKTCILLNLLHLLSAECRVKITISAKLAAYVEKATGARIADYRLEPLSYLSESIDVLLVDDPSSANAIQQALEWHKTGQVKVIVIAFDPLQLSEPLTDGRFQSLVQQYNVQSYTLNACYRQKKNVGATTKHVVDMVAASTPFLDTGKIERHRKEREQITSIANELRFINPRGYVEYYAEATVPDVQKEVQRILRDEYLMWQHTPGLLVVEGLQLTESGLAALQPLLQRNYVERIGLYQIHEVKGLEFQHVFIFIGKDLYEQLQYGFKGSGQNTYNQRSLFRIPFSRARDSLVTFVNSFTS